MSTKYLYEVDMSSDSTSAKIIKLVGKGKKVLEVGCAAGSQSKVMKEQFGCSVTGVEIDADAANEASRYCDKIITGNIESLDMLETFKKEKYDVAIFADVLEHLYDPVAVLIKVSDLLTDDGYLVVSIPNIVHASVVFEMMTGNFTYRNLGLLDEGHIRFFTLNSIVKTLNRAGYLIDCIDRVQCDPSHTEFNTRPQTKLEKAALGYIIALNIESLTYQYIIRARKGTKYELADQIAQYGSTKLLSTTLAGISNKVKWKDILRIVTKIIFSRG
ncbi:class I SAM-dependent methyltransferase [Geobacter grbiciae]|uniref:class I SAM-dependent methyltransferase n=1 Tax=Geobacter grbiciae TaxID=155042 RepID=UPI001C030124